MKMKILLSAIAAAAVTFAVVQSSRISSLTSVRYHGGRKCYDSKAWACH